MRQADPATPVKITYEYRREKYAGWESNQSLPLFPVVELALVDADKAPEHDIDLGAPRTVEAHSTMTLPPGYRAELPDAVHVSREFATYDKTYRLVDGKVVADRKIVILVHKLPHDRWKDYVAFQKATLVEDGEPYLRLIPSGTPAPSISSDKADVSAAGIQGQLAEIQGMLQHRDVAGAKKRLLALRQSNPEAAYVQGMLGFIEVDQGQTELGLADLTGELKAHPDDPSNVVVALASSYSRVHRDREALDALKKYGSPTDDTILRTEISLYEKADDYQSALSLVEQLVKLEPQDLYNLTMQADVLRLLKRNSEAAVLVERAVDGSDDPLLINNSMYVLSEMKLDLPFAETQSRRAVEMLETATASRNIDEVNNKAFAESSNLTASWDTLAFILMLEDKAADALPLLEAAWFNRQDLAVADHLGRAYETLKRPQEALWIYQLGLSLGAQGDKESYAEVYAAVSRLKKSGVKAANDAAHPNTLQEYRSHKIKRAPTAEGGGTFRVQMSPDGVAAASLISGGGGLKPLLDTVRSMPMHGAEPAGSKARVLRDAVVYCSKGSAECDFVFMISSGVDQEGARE